MVWAGAGAQLTHRKILQPVSETPKTVHRERSVRSSLGLSSTRALNSSNPAEDEAGGAPSEFGFHNLTFSLLQGQFSTSFLQS